MEEEKKIGDYLKAPLCEVKSFIDFFNEGLRGLTPPYARASIYVKLFWTMGIRSIPIVLIVGSFVGLVLSVMTYAQFSKLGVESLIGPFIAVPMVSQLGPVMTALMILCRVGSALTAEIGTMRVSEQVDALRCFGVNPIRHLIVPRVVVGTLLLPLLTVISDFVGIWAGQFLSVGFYGVNEHYYTLRTQEHFTDFDIYVGLVKALVFGAIITVICCYKGYTTRGGASGVGRSIMDSVVVSFIAIIVSNFFLSVISTAIYSKYFE